MRMNFLPARPAITIVILFLSFMPAADAQQSRIERLEIIGAGFLSYEQAGERTGVPDAVDGKVIQPRNMRFLPDTPTVTARTGTSFGVRYMVVGQPRGADVTLRSVWKIPPPGITDPKSGKTYKESASEFTTKIGTAYLDGMASTSSGRSFAEPGRCKSGKATASYSSAILRSVEYGMIGYSP